MSVAPRSDALLEREDEIARISALLDAVGEGSGRLVLVEGPAGIGKTTLLKVARSAAADRGFATLNARCSLIEQEFAFGVARQLFERKVRALNGPARAELLSGAAALAEAVVLGQRSVAPGSAPHARRSSPLCMVCSGFAPISLTGRRC